MKKIAPLLICALLLSSCTIPQGTPVVSTSTAAHTGTVASTSTAAALASPAPSKDSGYSTYRKSKDAAVAYLKSRLDNGANTLYVYKDFSDSANHFTQRAKIDDGNSDFVFDMNENWQVDP